MRSTTTAFAAGLALVIGCGGATPTQTVANSPPPPPPPPPSAEITGEIVERGPAPSAELLAQLDLDRDDAPPLAETPAVRFATSGLRRERYDVSAVLEVLRLDAGVLRRVYDPVLVGVLPDNSLRTWFWRGPDEIMLGDAHGQWQVLAGGRLQPASPQAFLPYTLEPLPPPATISLRPRPDGSFACVEQGTTHVLAFPADHTSFGGAARWISHRPPIAHVGWREDGSNAFVVGCTMRVMHGFGSYLGAGFWTLRDTSLRGKVSSSVLVLMWHGRVVATLRDVDLVVLEPRR